MGITKKGIKKFTLPSNEKCTIFPVTNPMDTIRMHITNISISMYNYCTNNIFYEQKKKETIVRTSGENAIQYQFKLVVYELYENA